MGEIDADVDDLGRRSGMRRQSGVLMVVCYRFGMNCSAPEAGTVKARASLGALVYTALVLCAASASAQETEEIDDAAGRIQYSWFTGDARELQSALTEMEGLETDAKLQGLKAYHLAYGCWRLAQLHALAAAAGSSSSARSQATSAAQACGRHAQEAIAADARNADAYAIQAICPAYATTFAGALRNGRRDGRPSCRTGALRTANSLEPGNPRVLLIDRLCMAEPRAPISCARSSKHSSPRRRERAARRTGDTLKRSHCWVRVI